MENKTSEKIINEFTHYFKELLKDSEPMFKLFRTESTGYLYDTGTNKIFGCGDVEYCLLEKLKHMETDKAIINILSNYGRRKFINSANNIKKTIENENILLTKKAHQFGLSAHYRNIEKLINSSFGMIQLETTERCNLRCGYCIYNPQVPEKRNHGNKDMTLSIAHAAIDYLAEHSTTRKDVSISFYGGEPLLRFPFIKSCVDYAYHRINRKKEINFSFTTNGTLITPEMTNYFYKENFNIMVSLDGPEDIHNNYRKNINGEGSFQDTINGLKCLIDVYGENSSKISLSMVYTPPYSEEKINRIAKMWDDISWLSDKIRVNITYPHPGSISYEKRLKSKGLDVSLSRWAKRKFLNNYINKNKSHTIANSLIEKKLAILLKRPIHQKPKGKYHLNGCCIPGVRKIFISTDGNMFLCERISKSPSIGHVNSGIDINKIKKIYINEYDKKSIPYCSGCWAIQLCNICYMHAFNEEKIDLITKEKNCIITRILLEDDLRYFCKLLEINPKGLNYLSKWVLI